MRRRSYSQRVAIAVASNVSRCYINGEYEPFIQCASSSAIRLLWDFGVLLCEYGGLEICIQIILVNQVGDTWKKILQKRYDWETNILKNELAKLP